MLQEDCGSMYMHSQEWMYSPRLGAAWPNRCLHRVTRLGILPLYKPWIMLYLGLRRLSCSWLWAILSSFQVFWDFFHLDSLEDLSSSLLLWSAEEGGSWNGVDHISQGLCQMTSSWIQPLVGRSEKPGYLPLFSLPQKQPHYLHNFSFYESALRFLWVTLNPQFPCPASSFLFPVNGCCLHPVIVIL